MKRLYPIIIFFLVVLSPVADVIAGTAPAMEPPPLDMEAEQDLSATRLLRDVVAHLPREPLVISGEITVRRRRGVVAQKLVFELTTAWGKDPAVATYTIRDAMGADLESLTVKRSSAGAMQIAYTKGDPPRKAAAPKLSSLIQDTDVSWMDLTLSFLWWPGGNVIRSEVVKGRKCHVIEIPAPDAGDGYAKVRLWIDQELRMLLQAEGYDAKDEAMRRLWVDSFKKINDRWMIKDMEIQSYPVSHRTLLRIHEVNVKE